MRLEKLMASILCLSFATALLPVGNVAVNAAALPDASYLLYEDFENVTTSTVFETPSTSTVLESSYVTETVTGEDGSTTQNTYIQYQNPEADKTSNNWYKFELDDQLSKIDKHGGLYEIGFRLKHNQNKQYGSLLNIALTASGAQPVSIVTVKNSWGTTFNVAGIQFNFDDIKPDTWMDVTVQLSFDDALKQINKIVSIDYITSNGTPDHNEQTFTESAVDNFWNNALYDFPVSASPTYDKYNSDIPWGLDDIYMKKLPSRTVTFMNNGEVCDTKQPTIFGNLPVVPTLDDVEPTWEVAGKDFTGWYEDENCEIEFENENITQTKTLYAGWVPRYYVKFNEEGGTDVDDSSAIEDGSVTLPAVTRDGYRFDGWFTHATERGDEYIFTGENITQNTEVWAGWTAGQRINLNANGGQAYVGGVAVDVTYDIDTISSLPQPTRLGYTFKGWYTDEALTTPVVYGETVVIPDMTVYAAWDEDWVVTLELNGGTLPESLDYVYDLDDEKVIYVSKGTELTTLPELTKLGANFVTWCSDETLRDNFDGTVVGDMSIYAKYDNVLFYEDFDDETNDTLDWLQNLTGSDYNKYKDEYGVVEDTFYSGEGNKSFRFATRDQQLIVPISNGGPGVYELSMKIRQDGPAAEYLIPQYVGSFKEGDTIVAIGGVNGNSPSFGTNNHPTQDMFTTSTSEWIYINYRYNTVSGLGVQSITYKSNLSYGTSKKYNIQHSRSEKVDSIILFALGGNARTGTNFYLDEISVKKIETPNAEFEIEGANVVDGVATDVELTPEIKINFSELMDVETLNTSTILVKDSEGNAFDPSEYRINTQVVNNKTVATVNIIKKLENASLYSVTITTEAAAPDCYVAEDIVYTFQTEPKEFEIIVTEVTTTSDLHNYTDVTSLNGLANIRVGIDVRNYSGGDNRKVFVGVAVVNKTTGKQYAYDFGEVTLDEGETQTVINQKILSSFGGRLTADDELQIFLWNGKNTRKPLMQVYKFPN